VHSTMANEQLALTRLQNYSDTSEDNTAAFFRALLQNSILQEGKNTIVDWIVEPRVTIYRGLELEYLRSKDTLDWGCDDETLRARATWWRTHLLTACIDLRRI